MTNKYNLSRTIPPDIKYRIRKDAYFGCVHCGLAIGDYEHIDPEFSDAKEHDPSKMTFLCPTINQKKQRGFVSKEKVWDWKINPWCKQNGHCHDSFDMSLKFIWIGGSKFKNFEKIITIEDECILSVKSPEEKGSSFRLSALFHDDKDNKILEITDNEWKAQVDVFDIICSGGKIGIRQDSKFVLKIICFPPNQIVIEEIDMLYKGYQIKGDKDKVEITTPMRQIIKVVRGTSLTATKTRTSCFLISSKGLSTDGINYGPLSEKMPVKPVFRQKCGVNEKCPCESGKKYKKCCHPKYDYSL